MTSTELTQLAEVPDLLYHAKKLVESRYIPEVKARKLVRECRLYADAFKDSNNYEEMGHAEKALEAVKEFSYWLHEKGLFQCNNFAIL